MAIIITIFIFILIGYFGIIVPDRKDRKKASAIELEELKKAVVEHAVTMGNADYADIILAALVSRAKKQKPVFFWWARSNIVSNTNIRYIYELYVKQVRVQVTVIREQKGPETEITKELWESIHKKALEYVDTVLKKEKEI